MYLDIMTGAIIGVACLDRCMGVTGSEIASLYLLGEVGGVPILFIKLILGLLILILFIISPNHHSHPFSLTPILFL